MKEFFYKYRPLFVLLAIVVGISLLLLLNYNLCYVSCFLGIKETKEHFYNIVGDNYEKIEETMTLSEEVKDIIKLKRKNKE